MIRMGREIAIVFDFRIIFSILSQLLVLPGGARRFYLLTLFIYEKIHP
jgi:hypothetical protein